MTEFARVAVDGREGFMRDESPADDAELINRLRGLAQPLMIGQPPVSEAPMPFHSQANDIWFGSCHAVMVWRGAELTTVCATVTVPYTSKFESLSREPKYLNGLERTDRLHTDSASSADMARPFAARPARRDFIMGARSE